jgi:glutamate-1-semialdehyde 2,1-aminomutase
LPVQTYGHGPLVQYRITPTPVRDVAGERSADPGLRRSLDLAMVRRGVFLNPMLTKIYVSLAHDDAALDRYLSAFDASLGDALAGRLDEALSPD